MYIWLILSFFAFIPNVLPSSFRGGLLSWKAVNETEILISHRVSYVYSYCSNDERNDTLQCISGCSGSVILAAYCTRNSSSENWADFEGVTTFDIADPTSTTLELIFDGSAWMSLTGPTSAGSWNLKMTVDLSQRDDTGTINHSPVSSMDSSLVLYQSCLTSEIDIPVTDADVGDDVRCRFASGSDECNSVCGNHISFLTLNESSCSFTISNLNSVPTGNYAMALQIEDFINSSSTVPLSSVPLQFVINVDSANPITFISPTPSDGSILQFTMVSLQFIAKARVHCTSIVVTKFNITSPLNFIMSNIKHPTDTPNEFEVTVSLGSVTKDRIGTHEMCFVAESTNG